MLLGRWKCPPSIPSHPCLSSVPGSSRCMLNPSWVGRALQLSAVCLTAGNVGVLPQQGWWGLLQGCFPS